VYAMPLVLMKKDGERFTDDSFYIISLKNNLPTIVAEALTIPGTEGELSFLDVEVYVSDFGSLDTYNKQIEITILANKFPERLKNLKERHNKIINSIKTLTPGAVIGEISVWLNLIDGVYGEL
jgi:hypothetical protein